MTVSTLTYADRAALCTNPTAKKLLSLMHHKQTNLAVNCDTIRTSELLEFADMVGPHICVLKTHIDLLEDFQYGLIKQLQEVAKRHQFLLFEDRKFADIGTISKAQYSGGIYRIADWASLTNCHVIPGPGIIEGLREAGLPKGNGLLLLAQMSSSGSLAKGSYTEQAVVLANRYQDFVVGFICQKKLSDNPRFIHMTPGVKLSQGRDPLGQQYNTPKKVLGEDGSDIMIVGRGISEASNPAEEAAKYREEGWKAKK
jgi:orotidine 5'-phosphate decarboxylase subfamily 1